MKNIHAFYNESPTKTKTRQKVLDTAVDILSEQGIETVTMMDIARACNITTRNLYRYYASKEFLVMDVAFVIMSFSDVFSLSIDEDKLTGIQLLEKLLKRIHKVEQSDLAGIRFVRFIMYFDLFISKMPSDNPALVRYVTIYRDHIDEHGYLEIRKALRKGIEDGTIGIDKAEVDFYTVYVTQALLSVIMRTIVKEPENDIINALLVEKQIEVMIRYLGN